VPQFLAGMEFYFPVRSVQTSFEPHQTFWLGGAGDFQQMEGGQSVKLTVPLHQVPRIRMNAPAASLHLMHLWFAQGLLYLTMFIVCDFRGCLVMKHC
jgi:hypothetical protein